GEDPAEVRTMVPIVEQADVPAPTERIEELHQRPRSLGELEAAQPLVAHLTGAATHHVADMELRELVVAEVLGRVAGRAERLRELRRVPLRARRDADEDVGLLATAEAIV